MVGSKGPVSMESIAIIRGIDSVFEVDFSRVAVDESIA